MTMLALTLVSRQSRGTLNCSSWPMPENMRIDHSAEIGLAFLARSGESSMSDVMMRQIVTCDMMGHPGHASFGWERCGR